MWEWYGAGRHKLPLSALLYSIRTVNHTHSDSGKKTPLSMTWVRSDDLRFKSPTPTQETVWPARSQNNGLGWDITAYPWGGVSVGLAL